MKSRRSAAAITSLLPLNCRPNLTMQAWFAFVLLVLAIVAAPTAQAVTASITSPANNSTVSGTITVSASISGSYASVVFWRDNWTRLRARAFI